MKIRLVIGIRNSRTHFPYRGNSISTRTGLVLKKMNVKEKCKLVWVFQPSFYRDKDLSSTGWQPWTFLTSPRDHVPASIIMCFDRSSCSAGPYGSTLYPKLVSNQGTSFPLRYACSVGRNWVPFRCKTKNHENRSRRSAVNARRTGWKTKFRTVE